jgi:hypothetical protein
VLNRLFPLPISVPFVLQHRLQCQTIVRKQCKQNCGHTMLQTSDRIPFMYTFLTTFNNYSSFTVNGICLGNRKSYLFICSSVLGSYSSLSLSLFQCRRSYISCSFWFKLPTANNLYANQTLMCHDMHWTQCSLSLSFIRHSCPFSLSFLTYEPTIQSLRNTSNWTTTAKSNVLLWFRRLLVT